MTNQGEKKLQVQNLTISFRTNDGKVQAVRDISFDLHKGETMAIVGESGSGKSVTSKAILGILAGNAMIEGGQILYDGQDLLKISEDDFYRLRGDKIAMIFQDPLSSLNPIMKIGKQLTEAMLLKGKARQKESRATFNRFLKMLQEQMIAANNGEDAEKLKNKCQSFDKFEYKHLELEGAYNDAHDSAVEALGDAEALVFELSRGAQRDVDYRVDHIAKYARNSINRYVVHDHAAELTRLADELRKNVKLVKQNNTQPLQDTLTKVADILREAIAFDKPNFFAMGYYMTFCKEPLPEMDVPALNAFLRKKLDEDFMLAFLADAQKGLQHSAEAAYANKQKAIEVLHANRKAFETERLDRKACDSACTTMVAAIEAGIDRMEFVKDNRAYTFGTVLHNNIERYFSGIGKNAVEAKRFAKDTARYNKVVARGKTPDWQIMPESLLDLNRVRADILRQIDETIAHYEGQLNRRAARNYADEAVALVDFLKENASGVVSKVSKGIAKERAIKLMDEVGIPEARKRYNQYPFEFSGGMRQRIVIAIALAANPDILICDEPTTALDVTIQAQILELIQDLKRKRNLSVIFITHDLGVVANMADSIAVMYAGKIVEYGTSEEIFYSPAHPYTWALLSSMPDLDSKDKLEAIPGTPPDMRFPPKGDAFAQRNRYAMKIDFEQQPPVFPITDTHWAATWLRHPGAPKIDPPKAVTDRIQKMKARMEGNQDA